MTPPHKSNFKFVKWSKMQNKWAFRVADPFTKKHKCGSDESDKRLAFEVDKAIHVLLLKYSSVTDSAAHTKLARLRGKLNFPERFQYMRRIACRQLQENSKPAALSQRTPAIKRKTRHIRFDEDGELVLKKRFKDEPQQQSENDDDEPQQQNENDDDEPQQQSENDDDDDESDNDDESDDESDDNNESDDNDK